MPSEDALELRRDCPPGCQHCAPFPSQIINEIKVHSSHFQACSYSPLTFYTGVVFCLLLFFEGGCYVSKELAVRSVEKA